MGYFLNKGNDVIAGFCWAIAMIKPQLGLIFAIPLLMRRKWKTCFVAGIICLSLSIPPALMCNTSPLTMILQAPSANTFMFHGCGTWPYVLCGYSIWSGNNQAPWKNELNRAYDICSSRNTPYEGGGKGSNAEAAYNENKYDPHGYPFQSHNGALWLSRVIYGSRI